MTRISLVSGGGGKAAEKTAQTPSELLFLSPDANSRTPFAGPFFSFCLSEGLFSVNYAHIRRRL